jgi:hypothetical protein
MVHCSATTPPSASRYTLRLWRQLELALRRGSWPAPRWPNAEACPNRRPRAGNSSWCVMPGRDAHLPTWTRSGAASRRPVEPRRTRHRRHLSLPRTPGIRVAAAGTRLGGCSASADRGPRCAYSSPRGTERRYADDRYSRRRPPGLNLRIWPLPATLFTAPPPPGA